MSQPRQILHLISSLDGYGESRQLLQLVERQLADGCQVRIVAFSASPWLRSRFEKAGVSCRVLRSRWPFDPIVAFRLAKEIRRQTHDLLHIWGPEPLRYVKFVSRSSTTVPCVATLSELPAESFGTLVDRFVVPVAQRQVSARTVVIPPGVEAPTTKPLPRAEFLELLSLPADARIIGLAGTLTRSRGLEEAIWCFELVRTLDEKARLLIFGTGPDRPRLERFSRSASEPSDIRFLGFQNDMEQWLPHLEVFWQLSREMPSASPPQTALEAMATQVPVVATEVPAHREMIEAGRTGFLFPVASRAICARHTMRLLQDQDFASITTQAAAEEVSRKYSLAAFLDSYQELYCQLTDKPRPTGR